MKEQILQAYKAFTGNDEIQEDIVDAAMSFAVSVLSYNPFREDVVSDTEYMNGNAGRIMLTRYVPIVSTETVSLQRNVGTLSTPVWETVDPDTYTYVPETGEVIFPYSCTMRGIRNYRISYVG